MSMKNPLTPAGIEPAKNLMVWGEFMWLRIVRKGGLVSTVKKMREISWLIEEQIGSTLFHGIRSLGDINIKSV